MSVCRLLSNPEDYEGKVISVQGELSVGPENFDLHPWECQVSKLRFGELAPLIWLTLPAPETPGKPATKDAGIEMEPNTRERLKTIISDYGMSRDYIRGLTPVSRKPWAKGPPIIIVTGRFDGGVRERTYPDGKKIYTGFGMLGQYPAQLVIKSVRLRVDPSVQNPADAPKEQR